MMLELQKSVLIQRRTSLGKSAENEPWKECSWMTEERCAWGRVLPRSGGPTGDGPRPFLGDRNRFFVLFEPPPRRTGWKYRTGAFLHAMRALPHARETCVRVSPQGILGVQHLVDSDSGEDKIFLEHMVCALEEEEPDLEEDAAEDDESDRPPIASPAF